MSVGRDGSIGHHPGGPHSFLGSVDLVPANALDLRHECEAWLLAEARWKLEQAEDRLRADDYFQEWSALAAEDLTIPSFGEFVIRAERARAAKAGA